MPKPGFCIFHDETGRSAAIMSVTDGREGSCAVVVLADAGGVTEIPFSESDLRWLIAELQERLPKGGEKTEIVS